MQFFQHWPCQTILRFRCLFLRVFQWFHFACCEWVQVLLRPRTKCNLICMLRTHFDVETFVNVLLAELFYLKQDKRFNRLSSSRDVNDYIVLATNNKTKGKIILMEWLKSKSLPPKKKNQKKYWIKQFIQICTTLFDVCNNVFDV